ncbi:hypothetical protein CesoFtcFv8_002364 [Champsocephalus esox]|uniref:Uncharacterized protein n=1 Tax=Champsocephalus esox TaxID=159716 RepID=A0AAN8CYU7_9TELE|nr:hypothetical protein CesoFtcFv8_002364 [Champsocephalus esox]
MCYNLRFAVTSVSTPVTPLTSGRTVYTPSISDSSSSSPLTQVKPTAETLTSVNPGPDQDITGSSVITPGIKDSSNTTAPQKTASAGIWTFVAVVAGCGVTVGVILLVSGIPCTNRRTAGSQEVKGRQEHHNENMETCHMYAAISEEPAASDLKSIIDPSSITIYNTVEKESSTTQSIAPSNDSTGLTVISPYPFLPVTPAKQTSGWTVVMSKNTGSSSSSSPTPVKAASEIWKFVAVLAGCGVAVGVILLVSALLCNDKRTAGPDEVKRQDTKVEYSETYHMYCSEEPAASDLNMGQMYSPVQSH